MTSHSLLLAAKELQDEIVKLSHDSTDAYHRLTPTAVNQCLGAAPAINVRGERNSGKSTFVNVLLSDIAAPYNLKSRIEIRHNAGLDRATLLLVRNGTDKKTISFDVPSGEDMVDRSRAVRPVFANIPAEWLDSNGVLWYPVRPQSAASGCTVVEEHLPDGGMASFTQSPNEIVIYMVNGNAECRPGPKGINAADPTRTFVVVNYSKNTDDRSKIADTFGVEPGQVFFVDCVRMLADKVLPQALTALTPSQLGAEWDRLERKIRLASHTIANAKTDMKLNHRFREYTQLIASHVQSLQQRVQVINDTLGSMSDENVDDNDRMTTTDHLSDQPYAISDANRKFELQNSAVVHEHDAWHGAEAYQPSQTKWAPKESEWTPKPSDWQPPSGYHSDSSRSSRSSDHVTPWMPKTSEWTPKPQWKPTH